MSIYDSRLLITGSSGYIGENLYFFLKKIGFKNIVLIDKKGRLRISVNSTVADGVGFEPTRRSHACRFSRPVPSTARPPIQKTTEISVTSVVAEGQ